jgi:dTMP kinase
MTTPGKFLTFEGLDGAGKSTALRACAAYLEARGIAHVVTREPGGTPAGESIRAVLLDRRSELSPDTELLLVFAARAEHLARVIQPALGRGSWVLCDRFTDATYAYQGGGRGIPDGRIDTLRDWVQGPLRPDLTVLVDASVELAGQRLGVRGDAPDRFESEAGAFHERVRAAYLAIQAREPGRVLRVPAEWTPEAVAVHLTGVLDGLLGANEPQSDQGCAS